MGEVPSLWVAALLLACAALPASAARDFDIDSLAEDASAEIPWSCWSGPFTGLFLEANAACGFPPAAKIQSSIQAREASIAKFSGKIDLAPNGGLNIKALPDDVSKDDLKGDVQELMVDHVDTCAGSLGTATSGEQIYENIKVLIEEFDIHTRCSKVVVPRPPKIRKGDVVAVITERAPGRVVSDYEDVVQYQEHVEDGTRTLIAIVAARKESALQGGYDLSLQLLANGTVRLSHVRRRHVPGHVPVWSPGAKEFVIETRRAVDHTMIKLAYAGLYGRMAFDEHVGCYEHRWCPSYNTLHVYAKCSSDAECESGHCEKTHSWCAFHCERRCAA